MCLPKMASAFAFDDASPPSGEWEGHMVDFIVDPETKLPNATKLPDYIVPQATTIGKFLSMTGKRNAR